MTDFRQRPETPGFEVDDEMDLLFGRANPNPNREGCLPVHVLKSLALRERAISDSGFEHLAHCSPCFREYRGFQQANARLKAARRTRYQLAAAAVVALLVGAGSWVWLQRDSGQTTPGGPAPATVARIDLRPFSVTQGTELFVQPDPLALPQGLVSATILLPVGAELATTSFGSSTRVSPCWRPPPVLRR
jgi:hypothetical protein